MAKSLKPAHTRVLLQNGHPVPCERFATETCHSWPNLSCHHTFRLLPAVTSSGVSPPLSAGCHCSASCLWVVPRSLTPHRMRLPAQTAHPLPRPVRWLGVSSQEWPCWHTHQTFTPAPAVVLPGVLTPFFCGSHSAAKWGWVMDSGRATTATYPWSVDRSDGTECYRVRNLAVALPVLVQFLAQLENERLLVDLASVGQGRQKGLDQH